MPDRPDTLQLPVKIDHAVDWAIAASALWCLPGRVIVEMLPWGDRYGELYLPEQVAANLRPDVGVVLAVGSKAIIGREGELLGSSGLEDELQPGDHVIVRGYDGTWREGFECGPYKAKGQVRCYGVWQGAEDCFGETKLYPWHDSIFARITTGMNIIPLRNLLLVRRDPLITTVSEFNLALPDDAKYRNNWGTIVERGPRCSLEIGDRVLVNPQAFLEIDCKLVDSDMGFMSEDAVETVERRAA
jgi:co-chaperonin GroES (HSP10)